MLSEFQTVRTNVAIPSELLTRSQHFIGEGKIPDQNALVVAALEHFLKELERQEIDSQFEAMANDTAYQFLNQTIVEEF